jgi:ParB family chromosome partitioning protein
MLQILSGDITKKKRQAKQAVIKLKPKLLEKYFSREQRQSEIEEIIDKALAFYFEHTQAEE